MKPHTLEEVEALLRAAPSTRDRLAALCVDCKKRPAADQDALCSECRAANTVRNMTPGRCACGKPLPTGKYRSRQCYQCEHAALRDNVRRHGSG